MNLTSPLTAKQKFNAILCLFACLLPVNVFANTDENRNFSFMQTLADAGLHDMHNEWWNTYGQATYISSWKSAFPAAYSNLNSTPNSLSANAEQSFTATVTFYMGLKAWRGAEIYLAPEMISELPLSGLKGLGGGIQNFELQKNGSESATWYRSRFYLKQTFNLGGSSNAVDSGPLQLAGMQDSRRLVVTVGNLSILDIFDKNSYSGDLRNQFFNMAFLANAAYDFAADARGYSVGMAVEYYLDDWTFRFGHFATPKQPNQLELDYRLFKFYGEQIELEHRHNLFNQPGAARILAYRNNENMGNWNDAMAAYQANPAKNAANCTAFNYDSTNNSAPDLCWVRKANVKMGIGVNLEQRINDYIGVFFRGMVSDGKTEVYSYTSSDRSLSVGTLINGGLWNRSKDAIGIGFASSWLSASHVDYLNRGGIDGFIGDGKIRYQPEHLFDVFYKLNVISSAWVSADYQHITNPAYNADRGPVDIFGVRVHFEF